MLNDFLISEASYKEMADEILHFINSYEIRKGEFECNSYVIEKIDFTNLIIYREMIDQSGNKSVCEAFSIYRKDLQKAMLNKAHELQFELNKGYLSN